MSEGGRTAASDGQIQLTTLSDTMVRYVPHSVAGE